jgi:hypothetical protein
MKRRRISAIRLSLRLVQREANQQLTDPEQAPMMFVGSSIRLWPR